MERIAPRPSSGTTVPLTVGSSVGTHGAGSQALAGGAGTAIQRATSGGATATAGGMTAAPSIPFALPQTFELEQVCFRDVGGKEGSGGGKEGMNCFVQRMVGV